MVHIKPFTSDFDEYRKDESRAVGEAASISFPTCEADVCAVLAELYPQRVPVTVQGGRTGLASGAVPHGGHVMNLSKMTRALGMRAANGTYYLQVEPGTVLSQLRGDLEDKNINTAGWSAASLAAWEQYTHDRPFFFPTDPTETSATIGGMVACNASGARSYRYGPVRPHVSGLRVVLADGATVLDLRRDQTHSIGRSLELLPQAATTGGAGEQGRQGSEPGTAVGGAVGGAVVGGVGEQGSPSHAPIHIDLPGYHMPATKNASGYFAEDNMDAIDLFIGSDGTLGVITLIELELTPTPQVTWGVSCFFEHEGQALDFTVRVRDNIADASALEFFDAGALQILRQQKTQGTAFAGLPAIDPHADCCIYVELQCVSEDAAYEQLYRLGAILEDVGGSEQSTWVGRTDIDREQQRFFRHAVPESTNMLIDERKKTDPAITKLGSDMSVPNERLHDVMAMYRTTLQENDLQTAVWGHIGNNHLHVNVLPRDMRDYARGKALYQQWAQTVTNMGGAVSAEHGVGKLKRDFLTVMYGEDHIRAMARTKLQLDPHGIFGRGNLFSTDVLNEVAAAMAGQADDPHAFDQAREA